MIKSIAKYFWLTIKHKYFVFIAGLKIKVPLWRLLVHDWSKFLPSELPHYGRQFFGKANDPYGFIQCWVKHQNRNTHHWEYWVPRTGHNKCNPPYPDNEPIPMPISALKEMVADWMGASRAYEGKWPEINKWNWLQNNFNKIRIHKDTREKIITILIELKLIDSNFLENNDE